MTDSRNLKELPVPDTYKADRPDRSEYETDVLVIGGGFAGLNAAYTASLTGCSVLLVDKGRPGWSGQSAWPGTFNYFDPERGDDAERYIEHIRYGNEFVSNLSWVRVWIEESKAMKERIESWGMLDRYSIMCETEYWERRDYYGFRNNVVFKGGHERRGKFVKVLNDNNIPWIQHLMIMNLIVQGGRCVGAVGYQFTTGEIITIHAKAVVLAAGNGSIANNTHPCGDNTFDGMWMAWQLGLPITGCEWEDFHTCQSHSSALWALSDYRVMDPCMICGGQVTDEMVAREIVDAENTLKTPDCDDEGLPYWDAAVLKNAPPDRPACQSVVYGKDPEDDRAGKRISPSLRGPGVGGNTGMSMHTMSGVLCSLEDTEGFSGIPGLWVAGDGTHASSVAGSRYVNGNGFTACFCAICGDHAGKAAAAFAGENELVHISAENLDKVRDEILAPMRLEKGFDAMWARDVLLGIMAPYWVSVNKSEQTLKTALDQVLYMKEHIADHLIARLPHELRLCHEMKHKILASELKLRAGLAREESRGRAFYRNDHPDRDDENWTKFIVQKKDASGRPEMSFVDLPEEWTKAGTAGRYADGN